MNLSDRPERTTRRKEIVGAALQVLAQSGSRGLTHREVDRLAGLPLGSTSNYYRKRIDLLVAVGAHVMELDLADTRNLKERLRGEGGMTIASVAEQVRRMLQHWSSPSQRMRGLARVEILIETVRSRELREAVGGLTAQAMDSFSSIFQELGAPRPRFSADLFLRLLTSVDLLILSDHEREGRDGMITTLVTGWLELALQASSLKSA